MAVTLIKESKNLKEELTNFTIEYYDANTPEYETDDVDIKATSGKEALAKFKKSHPDAKIYMMYDESDIFYNTETGEEDEEETRRQNQSDYPEASEGYEEESCKLKESAYRYTYTWDDDLEPEDDYEKELKSRSGQKCKILKDNGNGNYEIEFEDGSQYDATDDELEESCKLKEALGDDERVKQVSFDIVVPEDADLDGQEFYEAINEFVDSLNYKLTGTVNVEDLTDDYRSQGYEI